MPKLEIDYKFNIGSLVNAGILLLGFVGAAIAYYSDQKLESANVKTLQAHVIRLQATDEQITAKIIEAQQQTTNRLGVVETQNSFMLRSLNRLETSVDRLMRPAQ